MSQYFGDIWRQQAPGANLTVGSSGGTAVSTSVFGTETYAIQVCHVNSNTGSTSGIHMLIDTAPAATSTAMLLPANWVYIAKVTPGQKASFLSNDAQTPTVNVVELTK